MINKKKKINEVYEDDIKLFPDIETYISDLTNLENFDFSNKTPLEIYNIYYDYAKHLPTYYNMLGQEIFNDIRFYRARININKKKEDISLIQTYSYPPNAFCNQNGRANLKYRSVFYCSNQPYTAILESKPKAGDEGFLSVWKGNTKRKMKIGNCLPYNLPNNNEWNLLAKDAFELQLNYSKKFKEKANHFIALNKFIANRFVFEREPYPITSMLSYEMIFGDLWRDFIIYPSVIADTNSCNMAFHPNSVNQNLIFEKVYRFKVEKGDGNDKIKILLGSHVGEIENNKMIWRKIKAIEQDFFQ